MAGTRFGILSRGLNRKRGEMNKLESAYAAELEAQKLAGEIAGYWFEPLTLRLSHPEKGQPARFAPDFLVLYPDGRTCLDDVKSNFADFASGVRIKTAAELFPLWVFRRVKKKLKRDGGGWDVTEV